MRENSCWLIEYNSGEKFIVSEELYKQFSEEKALDKDNIICESHYFDIDICKRRNLSANIIE